MSFQTKSLLFFLGCVLIATPSPAADADQWRADLSFLAAKIKEIHPDPFRHIDEEEFDTRVNDLSAAIPNLEEGNIIAEIQRLIALLRDGHSGIQTATAPAGYDMEYPIVMYPFEDGVYVTSALPAYRELVGKRVVRIGTTPIDDAIETVSRSINGENAFTIRDRVPRFQRHPCVDFRVVMATEPAVGRPAVVRAASGRLPDIRNVCCRS